MTNDLTISRSELWKSPALGPIDVDFGAMGPGPHTSLQKEQCNRYFLKVWLYKLTDQEYSAIEQWPNLPADTLRSMNHKLDESILEMAEVEGLPFIGYCLAYQRRMADWRKDPDGPRLYRKYGEALARGAEIEQAPPYEGPKAILQEPHAYMFRERAVIEWGLLRERIKSFRAENPHVKAIGELWPFIKSEVLAGPTIFLLLKSRLSHLEEFLSYHESENNLDKALRWRADGFVKQWMSYGSGREAVSLGHDIGKMGKALKAQSVRK